jgi:serine/threonine-protein kinase
VPRGYNGKWWNRILWTGDAVQAQEILDGCPVSSGEEAVINRYLSVFYARDFSRAGETASAYPAAFGEQFTFNLRSLMKAWAYAGSNLPQLARAEFDSARVLLETLAAENPDDARIRSALGFAYAGLGRREDAVREGRAGVDLFPVTRDAWIHLERLRDQALVYAQVGEQEAAIDILEDLLGRPGNEVSPALLRIHPLCDPLRDNSRFQRLVEPPL